MVGSFAPGSIASLDLTALTYSVAVAEHLGFRQAAAALGVNQSVLSRRVQALEEHLQVALFERGSRGSRLTNAGERFLEEAREALSDIDHAAAIARASGRGEEGGLHVGFYTPLSGGFLRELVRRYRTDHPYVAVELREEARRTLLMSVRQRRLDVAFVIGLGGAGGCDMAELWSEPVYVAHSLAARSSGTSWPPCPGSTRTPAPPPGDCAPPEKQTAGPPRTSPRQTSSGVPPIRSGPSAYHWPGFTPPAAASRRRSSGRLCLRRVQS